MGEKCANYVRAKEGIDTCSFCGKKKYGLYFGLTSPNPKDHGFECIDCHKKHWGY